MNEMFCVYLPPRNSGTQKLSLGGRGGGRQYPITGIGVCKPVLHSNSLDMICKGLLAWVLCSAIYSEHEFALLCSALHNCYILNSFEISCFQNVF